MILSPIPSHSKCFKVGGASAVLVNWMIWNEKMAMALVLIGGTVTKDAGAVLSSVGARLLAHPTKS